MIQLSPDCLIFQVPGGEAIPCSAEVVTIELIGDAAELLDPEVIRQAAGAVLHYFKIEQGRHFVSVGEFSEALADVLRRFGLTVNPAIPVKPPVRVVESDLRRLACDSGKGFELAFFPRLRQELRQQLDRSPHVVRFNGLRSCVKQLAGARRWTERCQQFSDHIVEYLRHCLSRDNNPNGCAIVVK